jgi:hypothetical protein
METVIYCDREDCTYNCEGECQRTTVKITTDVSYSGAYCESVKIKRKEV